MIHSVGLAPSLMLSRGLVQNQPIPKLLQEETVMKVIIPLHPQLMGAYSVALIGLDRVRMKDDK